MRLIRKTVIFALVFSVVFFVLHTADFTGMIIGADLDDLGGVPWLYSAVCLIFSILAGFIIQHEWDQWNALVEAVNGEVSALQHLWLWSQHVPDLRISLHKALRQYLTVTIQNEWGPDAQSESEAAQKSLSMVWEAVAALPPSPGLVMPATAIVGDLLRHREHRLHSGQRGMPQILKVTVGFADGLVIVLSLFIGVKHLWLDYLFTLSIALLAYVVYLVVDDLDHPLRPGIWYVTSKRYERLLAQLQQQT
jgi:hypothetical protein